MNYGSVCSGIEAATVAWEPLGWQAKFFAEVEPFPSAVLCHRLDATRPLRPLDPDEAGSMKDRKLREAWLKQIALLQAVGTVPNLGDFTKIRDSDYEGNIDLLAGGTPCQSYSLAGLRRGLDDPRGNLALEFVRLAYRTGARWTVWENVPGVLSSGGGSDFASFLSLLCGWEVSVPKEGWGNAGVVTNAPGCFGLAWRILDAQFTRVPMFPRAIPQRRRRLFVIGYRGRPLGHPLDWQYPAAVLFDGEMRERDTPPRRETAQGTPSSAQSGPDAPIGSRERNFGGEGKLLRCVMDTRIPEASRENVSPTLTATDYKGGKAVCEETGQIVYENHGKDSRLKAVSVSPTLLGWCGTGGNNLPIVQNFVSRDVIGFIKNDAGGNQDGYWKEVFPTVRSQVIPAIAMRECFNITPCDANGRRADRPDGGLYVTRAEAGKTIMSSGGQNEIVVVDLMRDKTDCQISPGNISTDQLKVARIPDKPPCAIVRASVRRLLPVETERLMGFPDGWTSIPWKGYPAEECPDAPRYKACGNSMCVNVMNWIGMRIEKIEQTIQEGNTNANSSSRQ